MWANAQLHSRPHRKFVPMPQENNRFDVAGATATISGVTKSWQTGAVAPKIFYDKRP